MLVILIIFKTDLPKFVCNHIDSKKGKGLLEILIHLFCWKEIFKNPK